MYFAVKVFKDTQNLLPQVGDTWVAFESTIRIGSKQYWISDIIDAQTHFLLASRLSASRKIEDIRVLIELAEQKARKIPARLITRRPSKYLKGADQALGLDCSKVQITRPEKGHEIKFSVHWHHILNGRSSIARNLKSLDTAQLVLKGWIDDYNYYSPQRALQNRTPAQVAGIDYKYATMVN